MHAIPQRYFQRAVPRYTSYPTAPHFKGDFPQDTVRDWLAELPADEPVSLYLHVPFCKQMCWYCGCNMKLAARYDPLKAYAATLGDEIDLVAAALPSRMKVSHLHWGGGTPTALAPDDLVALMERLRQSFDFGAGAELAIESDPRTLTAPMARTIGKLGFTRASFGVQEFDPKVQAAINRIQPPEMVASAVDWLRQGGVSGINFDLIYGLPHQTVEMSVATVRLAAKMRPDRIALFGYAHVPWMAKNQRMIPEASLPDAAARAAQAQAAAEALQDEGYVAIGLDHFALPHDSMAIAAREGKLRRNFQGYTTDRADTLLPFGASSIGHTRHGFWQNTPDTAPWARAVAAGRLPVAKGIALSMDDRLRGHVIERLMCDGTVDLLDAARRFGAAAHWADGALDLLRPMQADGLVSISGATLSLSPHARSVMRVAASAFDAYLPRDETRYSKAV